MNDVPNNSNCSFLLSPVPGTSAIAITDVKSVFAWLGILSCCIAAVQLIPKCRLLIYKIVLYCIIANGLHSIVQLVGTFHVDSNNDHLMLNNGTASFTACEVLGFLDQITTWMGHLCMTWVIVYLLYLLIKEKRLEEAHCSRGELVGIAVCFLAPFTFNWIPFLDSYYGYSEIWCWIILKNCSKEGLTFVVMFYYGPLLCFVLFNVISSLFMALRYFRNPKYRSKKFSFVMIIFPLIYGILAIIDAASFIKAVNTNFSNTQNWWILQIIVDDLHIIIPSAVVILASCGKSVKKKRHMQLHTISESTG